MQKKTDYLVSYDFGKSGVWGIMKANSVEEINAKYPELEVVKAAPNYAVFDIDDEPVGWLQEMVSERTKA
jgi:hypothetical protein